MPPPEIVETVRELLMDDGRQTIINRLLSIVQPATFHTCRHLIQCGAVITDPKESS